LPKNRELVGGVDLNALGVFLPFFIVKSHACSLNICLGGGGFNCIVFYSGTSFVFGVGQQISRTGTAKSWYHYNISLIMYSLLLPYNFICFIFLIFIYSKRFEGIEGTADLATICGYNWSNY
jgi:hypothetical protein